MKHNGETMRYCAVPGSVFVDDGGNTYILEHSDNVWSLVTFKAGMTIRNVLGKMKDISPMYVMRVGALKFGARKLRTKLKGL